MVRARALGLCAAALAACGDDLGPGREPPAEHQPLPSAAEVEAELAGLPFDAFLERSFELVLQRSPMTVVELGLEDEIDVGDRFLDDLSDEFARESEEVDAVVLELAGGYDSAGLAGEERAAHDAYLWYLDDRVRAHAFSDLEYRITPSVNSAAIGTQLFFTDIHPVADREDAERYVRRLAAVGPQMRQVRDVMARLERDGIVTPRLLLAWSRPAVDGVAGAAPRDTRYYRAFADKLAAAGIEGAAELLDRAEAAIADSVIPGYRALAELLAEQEGRAPALIGAWQYPDGDAYYAQALRHHVTAPVGADELHQLGLDELVRIHAELDARFAELGYPAGDALEQQIGPVAAGGGFVPAVEVVSAYADIIQDAEARLRAATDVFDVLPTADVVVTGVASGGFYVGPSLDGSRSGAFFATVGDQGEYRFGMRTLAYHEAVPGHHLQIGIAHDLDLPLFQRVVTFTGFAEGWALYAEWLAGDLGWYAADPTGDVGRLQAEAFRAARLVVDTGIHALGWSFDEAVDFFRANTGFSQGFSEGQIARYASWPGQATAYWMGRTRILDLRRAAEAALADGFDLAAFHRAVLLHGSVPLDVLAADVAADLGIALSPAGVRATAAR
jgi:uncharacterized protein (DUF885 family)